MVPGLDLVTILDTEVVQDLGEVIDEPRICMGDFDEVSHHLEVQVS